ncbi:MAG: hypothetical protein HKP48_05165 [Winogradskyella sp.]|nr:hypothetical protein [Winogradskyella sp.]NNK22688.1 hypothetical protein [Winogradskyella sp.]
MYIYIYSFVVYFFLISVFGCTDKSKKIETYNPPKIVGENIVESYFGKKIADPYRNMENIKDSTLITWYKKQTDYSISILDKIPNRDLLIDKLYEIDNRKSFYIRGNYTTESNNRFYRKKNIGEQYYKLYYYDSKTNEEQILFDPIIYKKETEEVYTINYSKPSWDEKYVVVSLSHSGKEISDLIIIETHTKRVLPVNLKNAWPNSFLGINWLPDSSGFTYLYFPNSDSSEKDFKRNTQSVLYTIGQDPNTINYIFGNKTHSEYNITPIDYPSTKIKNVTDKYIIAYMAGVNNFWDAYYAKIEDIKSGKLNWYSLYKEKHKIKSSYGIVKDDDYYFITSKNSKNYEIASTSLLNPNFDKTNIIFTPPNDEVIKTFRVTKNALYVTTSRLGIEAFLYEIIDGEATQIQLPKSSGRITLTSRSLTSNDIWVSL